MGVARLGFSLDWDPLSQIEVWCFPLATLTLAHRTTVSGEMVLSEAIKGTTAIS